MSDLYYYHNDFNNEGYELKVITEIIENKPEHVYIISDTEWFFSIPDSLLQCIRNNNIKLVLLFSSFSDSEYEKIYHDIPVHDIIHWPTFLFNWSYRALEDIVSRDIELINNNNFIYPFCSYNNRAHLHRKVLIDELARLNLIDKGLVSWVNNYGDSYEHDYEFKYFDGNQKLLNDEFVKIFNSFVMPPEYYKSLVHVIAESTISVNFITEKVAKPIFTKRPFIAVGKEGFNKKLCELGFLLYDELVDYSFDSEPDVEKRVRMMIESFNDKFLSKNYDLKEIYDMLYPKIEHNYNLAINIIKDKSLFPNIIINLVKENKLRSDDWKYLLSKCEP